MFKFAASASSFALLLATLASAQAPQPAVPPTRVAPVRAQHAMVVTIHHDATDAGLAVLHEGGNAVDAAVAVGFALALVHPAAGNIGGGGFMLIRPGGAGTLAKGSAAKPHFLDY